MSYEPAPHSEQLGARCRWMGQAKDLNVGPGGSGALLNMHTITKTNTLRQHMQRQHTHTHTHTPLSLHTRVGREDSHVGMLKLVMIGFGP